MAVVVRWQCLLSAAAAAAAICYENCCVICCDLWQWPTPLIMWLRRPAAGLSLARPVHGCRSVGLSVCLSV